MTDANGAYSRLLSPLDIGPMTCRNRVLQTAHSKLFGERHTESRRNRDYQVERARGGIGLVITGNHLVHPTSPSRHFAAAYARDAVRANSSVTAAVHDEGARIICQLNHLGANETPAMDSLTPFWGPSTIRSHTTGDICKAMELSDIAELKEWWGRSAEACREAGFDGVELHMGHGWLLHEFLSPIWNRRTDDYGGSFANRVRLPREVLDEVRRRVGSDFVVGARISLTDGIEGALAVEDAIEVAKALQGDGGIDYATMTAGGVQAPPLYGSPSDLPNGHLLELTAQLKAANPDLIVFAVGGINDPAHAERVLAGGVADMVAMTREHIADPQFVKKLREGREEEIYHCIRANQGCIGRVNRGLPIGCTINPAAGREAVFGEGTAGAAGEPKRWLVVGAGPAGLKAAVGLAESGHDVTIAEADGRIGGQVNLITMAPGRERLGLLVSDLERHLARLGVAIELDAPQTASSVASRAPDATIVATGARAGTTGATIARPLSGPVPGIDQDNVLDPWLAMQAAADIGQRVLIFEDDGTRYAAGVAEVLVDRGHDVTLVSALPTLFPATTVTGDFGLLHKRLLTKGLRYVLESWVERIDDTMVSVVDLNTGAVEVREADTVIPVTAREPVDELYHELREQNARVYRIGDAVAPRALDHAIYEGFLAGRERWTTEERHIPLGSLEAWEPDHVG